MVFIKRHQLFILIYTLCIMGDVKIVNSVVLLSLISLKSGSRLSPWCHGQATKPYRQVTIVQRSHGTFMFLGIQSFSPSHYTETTYELVRANFWTDEFFICAIRLNGTVHILLLYTNPYKFLPVSALEWIFFYEKRVTTTLVKTSWDSWGN